MASGYSVTSYGGMILSEPRMSSYAEALRRAVTPGCTVIDIGAGPGLFSLLACQYGAGKVIAIEPDPSVDLLPRLAKANGFADKITIVKDLSTKYTPDVRADVIVSDIRGNLPLFEFHIPTIQDARTRLLAPGGQMIPLRDTVRVALVNFDEYHRRYTAPWLDNKFGVDLAAGHVLAANTMMRIQVGIDRLMSTPETLAVLDYATIEDPSVSRDLVMLARHAGSVNGLLIWFDAELAEGIGYSTAPGEPKLVYKQCFIPFDREVPVAKGDRFEVRLVARFSEGDYLWSWITTHIPVSGAAPVTMRQSSFLGELIARDQVDRRSETYVPVASEQAAVDRACLALLDGQQSLGQISEALINSFPDRWKTQGDALTYVAEIAARYS